MVEAVDADHFLDDIGGAFDVVAAQGHGDLPIVRHLEIERFEDPTLLGLVDDHAPQFPGQCGIVGDDLG